MLLAMTVIEIKRSVSPVSSHEWENYCFDQHCILDLLPEDTGPWDPQEVLPRFMKMNIISQNIIFMNITMIERHEVIVRTKVQAQVQLFPQSYIKLLV